jgi:tetratricopeptide (TPR) repeat protein
MNLYYNNENYVLMEQTGSEAIKLYPKSYSLLEKYAAALINNDKFEEGIENFYKAFELAKNNNQKVSLYISISDAYLKCGNWEEAINSSNKGLDISSNHPNLLLNKGYALKKQGKEYLDLIIENEDVFNTDTLLAFKYALLDNREEAIKKIVESIKKGQNIAYIKRQLEFQEYLDEPEIKELM